MNTLWNTAVGIVGVGAVVSFVMWSLYREWIRLDIWQQMTKRQQFWLFVVFLSLTFLFATGGLVSFTVIQLKSSGISESRTPALDLPESTSGYITDHDGAGALLMTEPDFNAFISSSMAGAGEKVLGRLVNGTKVAELELKSADLDHNNPPWAKVKVLEGDLKDSVGWILMNSLRKP